MRRFAIPAALAFLLPGCVAGPQIRDKIALPYLPELAGVQTIANSARDWDRAARTIAAGLQASALLPGDRDPSPPPSAAFAFYVYPQQPTLYLQQLKEALEAEIIRRRGTVMTRPEGTYTIVLKVDVIDWGARRSSHMAPGQAEAVWGAVVYAGNRIILAYREPFYIHVADIPLYAIVPPPERVPSLAEQLAGVPRPLRYSPN